MNSNKSGVTGASPNIAKSNPRLAGSGSYVRTTGDQVAIELARVKRLQFLLQRELALARKMRVEAETYRRQTETRARSEAQRLILDTRLSIRREITGLKNEPVEEMKQALLDIRTIRLAAQEELEAQRQFTRAARIQALTSTFQDEATPPPENRPRAKPPATGKLASKAG